MAPKAEAPAPAPVAAAPAAVTDDLPTSEVETAFNEPELPSETAVAETVTAALAQEAADAEDEAVLDAVAMEMAAPDPEDELDFSEPVVAESEPEPMHVTMPPIVEPLTPVAVTSQPGPALAPIATQAPALQPSLHLVVVRRAGAGGRALARLDPDRERHPAQPGTPRQRPARADPPHEPGREDRVLLVSLDQAPSHPC